MKTSSHLPKTRILFALKEASGLSRHQQYRALFARCVPNLAVHGIYSPGGYITNPKHIGRAAIFWLVSQRHIAIQIRVTAPAELDCSVWSPLSQIWFDSHGRRSWRVEEIEIFS